MRITFTQSDFNVFARLSGDDNPIHVDPAYAASTHFGRTVAHGMLLFGVLDATTARAVGDRPLVGQEFVFTAGTVTDTPYLIWLDDQETHTGQTITTDDGEVTSQGRAFHDHPPILRAPDDTDPSYRWLEPAMTASTRRVFTRDEISEYADLVDDHRFRSAPYVPPALLGGVVSYLLGVHLPGPGTNWLKQVYRFHRQAKPGEPLDATAEVTRLRADKALVDLACRIESAEGLVVDGTSLVLAVDIPHR